MKKLAMTTFIALLLCVCVDVWAEGSDPVISVSTSVNSDPANLKEAARAQANIARVSLFFGAAIVPMAASAVTYEVTRDLGYTGIALAAGVLFDCIIAQGFSIGYEVGRLDAAQ